MPEFSSYVREFVIGRAGVFIKHGHIGKINVSGMRKIGCDKIEITVIIKVTPFRTDSMSPPSVGFNPSYAFLFRDIFKISFPVILEKKILVQSVIRYKNVLIPVVVIVADINAPAGPALFIRSKYSRKF
jgi:hypothetical protein